MHWWTDWTCREILTSFVQLQRTSPYRAIKISFYSKKKKKLLQWIAKIYVPMIIFETKWKNMTQFRYILLLCGCQNEIFFKPFANDLQFIFSLLLHRTYLFYMGIKNVYIFTPHSKDFNNIYILCKGMRLLKDQPHMWFWLHMHKEIRWKRPHKWEEKKMRISEFMRAIYIKNAHGKSILNLNCDEIYRVIFYANLIIQFRASNGRISCERARWSVNFVVVSTSIRDDWKF